METHNDQIYNDQLEKDFIVAYRAAGKPPAADVMALYDGGEVPLTNPGLHALSVSLGYYNSRITKKWLEDALNQDVDKYPGHFYRISLTRPYSPEMLDDLRDVLVKFLGPSHGVTVELEEGSMSIVFLSNDVDALNRIDEIIKKMHASR